MDRRSFRHGIDIELKRSKEFPLGAGKVFVKIFHGICELLFIFGVFIFGNSQLFFVFKGFLWLFVDFGRMRVS